jgi:hypothetical protein
MLLSPRLQSPQPQGVAPPWPCGAVRVTGISEKRWHCAPRQLTTPREAAEEFAQVTSRRGGGRQPDPGRR